MEKITSQDLWNLRNITDLKSLNSRVIFTEVQADYTKNNYLWSLYTLENNQPKKLIECDQEVNFILIDEDRALFCQNNDLTKIDLNTGKIAVLKHLDIDIPVSLIAVLSKNKVLLLGKVSITQETSENYTIIDELPSHFNGLGLINKKRNHIFEYNIQADKLADLIDDKYFNVHDFYLDQNKLYLIGDSYHHKRAVIPGLKVLDLATNQVREVFLPETFDISTSLFFNEMFCLNHQPYLFGNDDPHKLNKNPQFYALQDGLQKLIAKWDHSLGSWIGTDQAMGRGNVSQVYQGKYYFVSTITDHAEIFVFDGHRVEPYFKFSGSITAFAFNNKNDFYFIGLAANRTQQLYHVKNGEVVSVYDPNEELLAPKYIAQTKEITYTATHNSKQHGWILYPKDYDPRKRYPGILEIHGGPKTAYGQVFYHEMQVLASRGYFVFFTNIHGSDGQGNKFADISGHWGEDDYQDLMLFTDQVLAETPALDPNRLGVSGGSYGGFMTNWIIGHTNRFSAACSQRSIASEFSHSFLSDIGPADNFFENKATIAKNPEIFWQHSPLKYAEKVTTPTLFINSDQDYRCPLPEGMQMLNALLWHEVPARMCLFHGENHELSRSGRPANRIKRLDEMTQWFDQYLK
ncbi:MAG: alpha/beta hydrolase family protein [Lactobacillus sp.]